MKKITNLQKHKSQLNTIFDKKARHRALFNFRMQNLAIIKDIEALKSEDENTYYMCYDIISEIIENLRDTLEYDIPIQSILGDELDELKDAKIVEEDSE